VISVVVPVYNAERHLGQCVEAISAQPFADYEVIAVDDGSTDGSAALLAAWRARDARVRVVAQANAGPSAARNNGLAHAEGDYVWFVDADDAVAPDALGAIAATARAHDADIVAFNAEVVDGEAAAAFYRRPKPAGPVGGEEWIRTAIAQDEFLNYLWVHCYRRALLQQMRFVENILHEDIGWNTECMLRARRVVYIDRALYRHRLHAASLTGGRDDAHLLRRIEGYFSVVDELRAINERCPMSDATRRCLQAEIAGQGLQIDRLTRSLADPSLRARVRERCSATRFWERLWDDAVDLKRKRGVLKVLLRQRLGLS
jgi:glycosyltransferase involved in cell wall biosynthesis